MPSVAEAGFREFRRDAIEQSIPARFAEQVAAWPHRPAVSCAGASLTYAELNRQANAIAHAILARLGPGSEAVALLLPQGSLLIAAILGVLKAGKFYLGLDRVLPASRLAAMIGDVRARLVLTSADSTALAAAMATPGVDLLRVDDMVPEGSPVDPAVPVSPDDLAYIFYTSGTTGRPKGVIDNHRNVQHNVMRYTNSLHIGPTDRLTLLQSAGFSGSVSSLFSAILNGACVCPFEPRATSGDALARWITEERISIYHSTPSLFRHALSSGGTFPAVRIVRLEGDQAATSDLQLFAAHFGGDARLVNGLGTTETGLVRQFHASTVADVPGDLLPVGYPVADMAVAVVGPDRRPLPAGEVGEIAVRSRYLAVGYWEDPERTARRFRTDPDSGAERLYLTGDLGRLRADGCLEHLGRADSQVKLHGQTVELLEVEAALRKHPAVRDVAVVLAAAGTPRLVAYFVPAPGADIKPVELRRDLATRLPAFMVPATFVQVADLPVNENGKLDRKALPAPGTARPELVTPYVAPRDLVEHQLARVWERVLGLAPLGVDDDFFDLGGDSLAAMTMLTEVKAEFGLDLAPSLLLAGGTIARIAAAIAGEHPPRLAPVVEVQPGRSPLKFFYLHGDYSSGGFYCRKLAREIGPEVGFHVLPPCGRDGAAAPLSFAEMADRHLQAMRSVQPRGPYYLGGTCNGGLLAYEVALRLAAAGERVELLVLYVASASNLRFRRLDRAVGRIARLCDMSTRQRQAVFLRLREIWLQLAARGALGGLLHALRKSVLVPRELVRLASVPAGDAQSDLQAHYLAAERAYIPERYAGPVLLLWPRGEAESAEEAATWWRQLTPHLDVRQLAGSHHDCLTSEAGLLAREIADALRRCSHGESPQPIDGPS